jgi:peptide-methionine (S)-S-oxide reductase
VRRRLALSLLILAAACQQPLQAAEKPVNAPEAVRPAREPAGLKTAVFAGGCFWGVEGVFSHVEGVTSAVSGYHGGSSGDADYDLVSAGKTDHAESVRVTYDPTKIRYDQLLRIFFSVITDPTQLNRQGPDTGRHYRSALVPLNDEQRRTASAYLAQLKGAGLWNEPIVTRIERYKRFYPAETYHQDFMAKNPNHPYITRWDVPKVQALRRMFPKIYRADFTSG